VSCPCPCPGLQTAETLSTAAAQVAWFAFMHRLNAPAEVSPPIDAAWQTQAVYFGRQELSSRRIAGDLIDVFLPLTQTQGNNQSAIEQQFVSRVLPAGVDFTGAVAWLIGRNATVLGPGTVRPWAGLRVFDSTGTTLRAVLIATGEHGSGTNCTSNNTRLWLGNVAGGTPLAPYVSAEGDRIVLEVGYRMTGVAEAAATYGSLNAIAGNTNALHVASTAAEGVNPGARAPYLEVSNVVWPRAA
jgi:hypothetical protein